MNVASPRVHIGDCSGYAVHKRLLATGDIEAAESGSHKRRELEFQVFPSFVVCKHPCISRGLGD